MNPPPGNGAVPEPSASNANAPRASDDDRERIVTRLREAAGNGQIDLDELEQRIAATYEARTLPELAPITADLEPPGSAAQPAPSSPTAGVEQRSQRPLDNLGLRMHATTYALVIGFLVLIWLLSGFGHPWPLYPAAAWGIGLGSHWQAVAIGQHRRDRIGRRPGGHTEPEHRRAQLERRAKRTMERLEHHAERQRQRLEHLGVPTPPDLPDAPGTRRDRSDAPATPTEADRSSTPGPARRFVVATFVDVVGSTQLNEVLGDDGWVRVRGHFRTLVGECVDEVGGYQANTAGDGFLLRFEHPAHAVRCGAEILRRLDQQRAQTGFAPSVRIGVHSGDAVPDGDDIIGAVVNLASRVASAAEPDELWCTEHVADHLDGSWSTQGKGLHTLKGINRPRHLLAVRWR